MCAGCAFSLFLFMLPFPIIIVYFSFYTKFIFLLKNGNNCIAMNTAILWCCLKKKTNSETINEFSLFKLFCSVIFTFFKAQTTVELRATWIKIYTKGVRQFDYSRISSWIMKATALCFCKNIHVNNWFSSKNMKIYSKNSRKFRSQLMQI